MFSSAKNAGRCVGCSDKSKFSLWQCAAFALLAAAGTAQAAPAADWRFNIAVGGGLFDAQQPAQKFSTAAVPLDWRAGIHGLTFTADRRLGDAAMFRLDFNVTTFARNAVLWRRLDFRGTPAPRVVSSGAAYPGFRRARASYWRELYAFSNGGKLWVSAGLTYVMIDFRINAGVTTTSDGTSEAGGDFRKLELPVPSVGIRLSYPFTRRWFIDAGIEGGHLPWTNSRRRQGGIVQFSQTNADADIGLRYRSRSGWIVRMYVYAIDYRQRERSREINTYVRLSRYGIGVGVSRGF